MSEMLAGVGQGNRLYISPFSCLIKPHPVFLAFRVKVFSFGAFDE